MKKVRSFAYCCGRCFETGDHERLWFCESGASACGLLSALTEGIFCTSMAVTVGEPKIWINKKKSAAQ